MLALYKTASQINIGILKEHAKYLAVCYFWTDIILYYYTKKRRELI